MALRIVMFVLAEGGPTVLYLPGFVLVEGEHYDPEGQVTIRD